MAACAIVGVGLVLTTSRGGVLSMICQVLLLITLISTKPRAQRQQQQEEVSGGRISGHWLRHALFPVLIRVVLIAGTVGIVAVGIIWVGGSPLVHRFEEFYGESETEVIDDRSNSSRSDIWQMTWEMFKAHPVVGVGFGGYWIAVSQYHDASGEYTPQEAHNDFLEIAASGGLVGLALVVWFFIVCFKKVRKQLSSEDCFRRAACFGSLAGLFAVVVHSCVDFGLHVFINALVFTVLVVLASADTPTHTPEQTARNPKGLLIAQRRALM
ncbi:MAG: O-antigen ligase family protein [Pyrinomonadaceae bacterium]